MGTEKVFNSLIFAEIFGNKERNMYLCRAKLYSQYLKHKFVVLERIFLVLEHKFLGLEQKKDIGTGKRIRYSK